MAILTNFLTNIANAIREKTGESRTLIANDFPNEIRAISGGGGDISLPFITVNSPSEISTQTTINSSFRTSTGNYYINSGGSATGIWFLNVTTGTMTRIINNVGGITRWFEDSQGNVYATSNTSTYSGIYKCTPTLGTRIYTVGTAWTYWYEFNGIVYVGNQNSSGVLSINISTEVVTSIIPVSTTINQFYGDSTTGTVYVSSSTGSNFGLYAVTNNGTVATQVITTGNGWQYFYKSTNGRLFVGGNGTGIYLLNSNLATPIRDSTAINWRYFYEPVLSTGLTGNIYASSSATGTGILEIRPDNSVYQILSTLTNAYAYNEVFVSSTDEILFYGDTSTVYTASVVKVVVSSTAGGTAGTAITSAGNSFRDTVEDSSGNLIFKNNTNTSSQSGLFYRTNNGNFVLFYRGQTGFTSLYKDGNTFKAVTSDNIEYTFDMGVSGLILDGELSSVKKLVTTQTPTTPNQALILLRSGKTTKYVAV